MCAAGYWHAHSTSSPEDVLQTRDRHPRLASLFPQWLFISTSFTSMSSSMRNGDPSNTGDRKVWALPWLLFRQDASRDPPVPQWGLECPLRNGPRTDLSSFRAAFYLKFPPNHTRLLILIWQFHAFAQSLNFFPSSSILWRSLISSTQTHLPLGSPRLKWCFHTSRPQCSVCLSLHRYGLCVGVFSRY